MKLEARLSYNNRGRGFPVSFSPPSLVSLILHKENAT